MNILKSLTFSASVSELFVGKKMIPTCFIKAMINQPQLSTKLSDFLILHIYFQDYNIGAIAIQATTWCVN